MTVEIDKLQKKTKKISNSEILKHFTGSLSDVIVYTCTDSTNTRAKDFLNEGKQPPFLLAAEEQTAGRGRHGHTFFSPDSGLYYSLVLKPADMQTAIQKTTIAAAAALQEAIRITAGISCQIKWVNDLYYNQRKIAGILCEAPRTPSNEVSGIIIGIGVNIAQSEFPEEIRDTAGSLNCPDLDRNELAGVLTDRILYWMDHLNDPSLIQAYKEHSLLLGKQVRFRWNDAVISGVAVDINEEGNLIVEAERQYILNSGEVSLLSW